MLKKSLLMLAASVLLLLPAAVSAAELKVLVSGAMAHALEEISQDFARKNGHTLDFQVGTTGVLQDKVRKGEKADVIEVTSAGMDALEKEKIRKEADELQQPGGYVRCGDADDDGEPGDGKHSCRGGEIAEVIERVVLDGRDMRHMRDSPDRA